MPVNAQGVKYAIQKAAGGSYHVYADGRRVFVKAGVAAPAAAPAVAAPQAPLNYSANYYTQQALAQKQQDISQQGITADRTADQTNTAEAIRRLQQQRPQDEQSAKASANKAGLFYSGNLGKNLQNIATSYIQRQGDLQSGQTQREVQRNLQEQQLAAGGNIDTFQNQQSDLASQQQALADAAAGNYLVPNAPAPASTAVTPAASGATFTKNGKVYRRRASDGMAIYLGKA